MRLERECQQCPEFDNKVHMGNHGVEQSDRTVETRSQCGQNTFIFLAENNSRPTQHSVGLLSRPLLISGQDYSPLWRCFPFFSTFTRLQFILAFVRFPQKKIKSLLKSPEISPFSEDLQKPKIG